MIKIIYRFLFEICNHYNYSVQLHYINDTGGKHQILYPKYQHDQQ